MASLGGYIDDRGFYQIQPPCSGQCLYYNNQNEKGQGPINVATALTVSDDVFFYTLGADYWYDSAAYGQTPIQDVAEQYGLGRLTGIDLPNEYSGQVDSPGLRRTQHSQAPQAFPSTYYGIADNIEMAFGQGETLVTPLQEAVAYGTFATGGTRYAPQVVNAVISPTGKIVKQFKPRVMGHVFLPPDTYAQILGGLEGAIYDTNGTAYATFQGYSGMPLAGKTGTATESSNTNVQPTAWFVAFGPTSAPPLRRRRRDRPGGLRRRRGSPGGEADLHLPDQPPDRFCGPASSVERSLSGTNGPMKALRGAAASRSRPGNWSSWPRADQVDD